MDLNTSDLLEPDMDEQASQLSLTPFTISSSKSSLATAHSQRTIGGSFNSI